MMDLDLNMHNVANTILLNNLDDSSRMCGWYEQKLTKYKHNTAAWKECNAKRVAHRMYSMSLIDAIRDMNDGKITPDEALKLDLEKPE